MVHLVQTYYKSTNFCVITPYDAQRAAMEKALENANLPWDSVYNVDSFQGLSAVSTLMRNKPPYADSMIYLIGNEADYVLVSVVRSSQPGFLVSLQRMNVLLTRCRKGLVIVTSQGFLASGGRQTLLGLLLRHWQSAHSAVNWIDWRDIAGGTANLPGAPSRSRRAADRMVPFSVPGPAFSVPYGMVPFLRPNGAGSQLPTNGAAFQFPDLYDREHFPTLCSGKWPILPGSWAAHDMPPFSVPKVTPYSGLFRPSATNNSAPYVQVATEHPAAWVTSTDVLKPKYVGRTSTLDAQARIVQGIPRDGMTSTHNYHLHSHRNNKSMTGKEAGRKTKAKATQSSAGMAQLTHPKRYPATATALPSSKPLGNFIRSIVIYS